MCNWLRRGDFSWISQDESLELRDDGCALYAELSDSISIFPSMGNYSEMDCYISFPSKMKAKLCWRHLGVPVGSIWVISFSATPRKKLLFY